jgi:YbgC/YbaW family acyl-CoA thioester hydrolase
MAVEHVLNTRVEWVDTDAGGRIHFTAALRWAEAAETGLRRELGILGDAAGNYPRRRVEAEYHRVLVFGDEIAVRIRPESLGRTSITWAFDIRKDSEVYVDGRLIVVHVDGQGLPTPLTDAERAALEE